MKKYVVDFFIAASLIVILLSIGLDNFFITYPARSSLILIISIIIIRSFKSLFYDKAIGETTKNIATTWVTLSLFFLLIEGLFMFIPRSHGVGYPLSAKIWRGMYSNNINYMGYRDFEMKTDKPIILFSGDSFTWGHGTKNIQNRYSNIVDQNLEKYNTTNIGQNGFDTRAEFDALIKFIDSTEIIPNKIILQYFGNDIENVAYENGLIFTGFTPYSNLNSLSKFVIERSFLFNYIYWLYPQADTKPYLDFLTNAYRDTTIFEQHSNDLLKFVDFTEANSIELIVVLFPFFENLTLSDDLYIQKIVNLFSSHNVKTINVNDLVDNVAIEKLVVNSNDGHPSVYVNKIVANEIINVVKE